jgi:hypothetical protein
MGAYLYGISSKSRKVKGLNDVNEIKFITKARLSHFENDYMPVEKATIARYKKSKTNGRSVRYAVYDWVDGATVYYVPSGVKTFIDYNDTIKPIGFLKAVGKRFEFVIG